MVPREANICWQPGIWETRARGWVWRAISKARYLIPTRSTRIALLPIMTRCRFKFRNESLTGLLDLWLIRGVIISTNPPANSEVWVISEAHRVGPSILFASGANVVTHRWMCV